MIEGLPSLLHCIEDFHPKFSPKTLRAKRHGILIECNGLIKSETASEQPTQIPNFLTLILAKYPQVTRPLMHLPPHRSHDHAIYLKEGSDPISIRPYRYPYAQKTEIERMVQDMLKAGIIQPFTSPFASPVILVKKKDGSWCFCVDYRALNKVMVPNKFPIPVIDELLDELEGAIFFTKLD